MLYFLYYYKYINYDQYVTNCLPVATCAVTVDGMIWGFWYGGWGKLGNRGEDGRLFENIVDLVIKIVIE